MAMFTSKRLDSQAAHHFTTHSWKNAEMKDWNLSWSKVPLSFSSKMPSRKRSFCFLEMGFARRMHVQRNIGMLSFTAPDLVPPVPPNTFIHSMTFSFGDAVTACNWAASSSTGASPGLQLPKACQLLYTCTHPPRDLTGSFTIPLRLPANKWTQRSLNQSRVGASLSMASTISLKSSPL